MPRAIAATLAWALAAGCVLPHPGPGPSFGERALSSAPAQLVIDVSFAPGHAPSDAAREHLVDTLRNVSRKATISWDAHEEGGLASRDRPWNMTNDIIPAERATRHHADTADVVVLRVLYVAGAYERDGVAGVTLAPGGPATVFLDTLRSATFQPGLPTLPLPAQSVELLERSTLLHEASHALGLVNDGLPMVKDHEDKQNPGHSSDPQSVMYWKVDSLASLRELLLRDGSVPDKYDADDLADLQQAAALT